MSTTDDTMQAKISVRLPADQLAWLERRTVGTRLNLSDVIRLVIDDAMDADLLRRRQP